MPGCPGIFQFRLFSCFNLLQRLVTDLWQRRSNSRRPRRRRGLDFAGGNAQFLATGFNLFEIRRQHDGLTRFWHHRRNDRRRRRHVFNHALYDRCGFGRGLNRRLCRCLDWRSLILRGLSRKLLYFRRVDSERRCFNARCGRYRFSLWMSTVIALRLAVVCRSFYV